MKSMFAAISIGVLVVLTGCEKGTSGGPGVTDPPADERMIGQTDDTFSLDTPMMSTKIAQGETKEISIGINRGTNFSEDVSLKLEGLPEGVSLSSGSELIKHGDEYARFELTATENAAVGDFDIKLTGHPTKGADAVAEMRITIAQRDPNEVADAAAEAAQEKKEEYAAAMQEQLDTLSAEYADLMDRAAEAEGEAKADLDQKLAEAKSKLDAAVVKMAELDSSDAGR